VHEALPPFIPLALESPRHHCFFQSCHCRPPLPSAARSPETFGMGSSHLPLAFELLAVRPSDPQRRLDRTPMRPCAIVTTGPWWTAPCPVHRVVESAHANFRKKNKSKQTSSSKFCKKTLKIYENQPTTSNFPYSSFTFSPFLRIKSYFNSFTNLQLAPLDFGN
jgi:hypothetical protein